MRSANESIQEVEATFEEQPKVEKKRKLKKVFQALEQFSLTYDDVDNLPSCAYALSSQVEDLTFPEQEQVLSYLKGKMKNAYEVLIEFFVASEEDRQHGNHPDGTYDWDSAKQDSLSDTFYNAAKEVVELVASHHNYTHNEEDEEDDDSGAEQEDYEEDTDEMSAVPDDQYEHPAVKKDDEENLSRNVKNGVKDHVI